MLKIISPVIIFFLLTSCAHQSKSSKRVSKTSKMIVDQPVHNIASATTEEKSQDIIEKLLVDDEADTAEIVVQDTSNQVTTTDATYNEKDQAEDVIGKLLKEENAETTKVKVDNNFVAVKNHPLVNKWITYFTQTDRSRFVRFMTNGAKYRNEIEKIFEEEGLPKELFFVGMVESGFFLKAKSFANAVGPWQFIRATGKRYGLIVSRTLDERKDLYKSTHAAARYFRDLYKIFGSWELALSGYNSGEYGMMRRIKRGKSENFFNLASRGFLHPETVNYVPKVMAIMHIYQNLDRYNFENVQEENPFNETVLIKLKHSHSLRLISNILNIDYAHLTNLNTELPTPYTPFLKNETYQLRVPKSAWMTNGRELMAALSQSSSRTPSQTLALYERNQEGKRVLKNIFNSNRKLKFVKTSEKNIIKTNQPLYYTVQNGDNVTDIAKYFKTSVGEIAKTNSLNRNQIMKGQKIRIPSKVRTYYQVKRGDNLHSIAKKFNLTPNFLKQLNDLDAASIYTGQKLLVLL